MTKAALVYPGASGGRCQTTSAQPMAMLALRMRKRRDGVLSGWREIGQRHLRAKAPIPEVCGATPSCRNWIWWPDSKTREKAMALIGDEMRAPTVDGHHVPGVAHLGLW